MPQNKAFVWMFMLDDQNGQIRHTEQVDLFINDQLAKSATQHDFASGSPPELHATMTDSGSVNVEGHEDVRIVMWDRRVTNETPSQFVVRDPDGQRATLTVIDGTQQRRYDAAASDAQDVWDLSGATYTRSENM